MRGIKQEIISGYLRAYKKLLDAEQVDESTVIVSFPFHVSRDHRVEVAVSRINETQFTLSDMARTIGELKLAGYRISAPLRERLKEIAKDADAEISHNEIVRLYTGKDLGKELQKFAEVSKTIGDAYLVHKRPLPSEERIFDVVKEALDGHQIKYEARQKVNGALDEHQLDFYCPPNGVPGFAIGILASQSTHQLAQIWDFKCRDLKEAHPGMQIGLVYDVEDAKWSDVSERIIKKAATRAVPSTSAADISALALASGMGRV